MILTVFLSIVFCAAMTMMMVAAVAFIQDNRFFSSAPKEAQALFVQRETELFPGARAMGWTIMILSVLMILGVGAVSIRDGFEHDFTFLRFFIRFTVIFTVYKVYDMVFFDYFLLMKFHFFQHYYPETEPSFEGRKYGFNIKSQLLKLIIVFPGVSALAAWICSLF